MCGHSTFIETSLIWSKYSRKSSYIIVYIHAACEHVPDVMHHIYISVHVHIISTRYYCNFLDEEEMETTKDDQYLDDGDYLQDEDGLDDEDVDNE